MNKRIVKKHTQKILYVLTLSYGDLEETAISIHPNMDSLNDDLNRAKSYFESKNAYIAVANSEEDETYMSRGCYPCAYYTIQKVPLGTSIIKDPVIEKWSAVNSDRSSCTVDNDEDSWLSF